MSFLWKPEYNLNIKEIDDQHRKLFRLGRKLYECIMEEEKSDDLMRVESVLQQLKDYVSFHFNSEEKFMQDNGYVHYASHRNEHRYFEKNIQELETKRKTDPDEHVLKDIFDFIFSWILNHILKEDMKLKEITREISSEENRKIEESVL